VSKTTNRDYLKDIMAKRSGNDRPADAVSILINDIVTAPVETPVTEDKTTETIEKEQKKDLRPEIDQEEKTSPSKKPVRKSILADRIMEDIQKNEAAKGEFMHLSARMPRQTYLDFDLFCAVRRVEKTALIRWFINTLLEEERRPSRDRFEGNTGEAGAQKISSSD